MIITIYKYIGRKTLSFQKKANDFIETSPIIIICFYITSF